MAHTPPRNLKNAKGRIPAKRMNYEFKCVGCYFSDDSLFDDIAAGHWGEVLDELGDHLEEIVDGIHGDDITKESIIGWEFEVLRKRTKQEKADIIDKRLDQFLVDEEHFFPQPLCSMELPVIDSDHPRVLAARKTLAWAMADSFDEDPVLIEPEGRPIIVVDEWLLELLCDERDIPYDK